MTTPIDRHSMRRRNVVVACLGNADRGDDALGAVVAQELRGRLPAGVALVVRSGDMLCLIEDFAGCEALICVDAAAPMGTPGSIHRLDLSTGEPVPSVSLTSSHALNLIDAIRLARVLRSAPQHIIVYAVEGVQFDIAAPMSAAVTAAAGEVARRVLAEVGSLIDRRAEAALQQT